MNKVIDLVVRIATKAALDGVDKTGDAVERMTRKVDESGKTAEKTSRRFKVTAEGADDLGGKAGKATGALGALSSGFDLVGLDKYSAGLQSAALATDFFSGIGDGLNLILESQALANARAKASAIASAVATRAQALASKAAAVAQVAFNTAMEANPVLLVVAAVVALVAIFVVAYKKSETFRDIVNAVGAAGKAAIGWIVDKVGELVGWLKDKLPAAGKVVKTLLTLYFKAITLEIRAVIAVATTVGSWLGSKIPGAARTLRSVGVAALQALTLPMRTVIDLAGKVVTWASSKIPAAFRAAKSAAGKIGSAIAAPFQKVYDLIQKILTAIGRIHVPHISLPKIPGLGLLSAAASKVAASPLTLAARSLVQPLVAQPLALASGFGSAGSSTSLDLGGDTYTITINGAVDPDSTARQLEQILNRRARRIGR